MEKLYVQYGCGLSAPPKWVNFDTSPTLRLQKTPIIGSLLKSKLNTVFPENVRYGDIITGLPVKDNSCDGVYCSHVLEHLSLTDFRIALANTYKILKAGGTFRCVVPDLELLARMYLKALENNSESASIDFMGPQTLLGVYERPKGLKGFMASYFANSHHLWMWDNYSLANELKKAGFKEVRRAEFNDSEDAAFKLVEDSSRFEDAVALDCKK